MTSSEIKIVPKGWGYEKWIVNTEEYCGKLLHFIKGKRCSWHYHILKDETFYVQEGKLMYGILKMMIEIMQKKLFLRGEINFMSIED